MQCWYLGGQLLQESYSLPYHNLTIVFFCHTLPKKRKNCVLHLNCLSSTPPFFPPIWHDFPGWLILTHPYSSLEILLSHHISIYSRRSKAQFKAKKTSCSSCTHRPSPSPPLPKYRCLGNREVNSIKIIQKYRKYSISSWTTDLWHSWRLISFSQNCHTVNRDNHQRYQKKKDSTFFKHQLYVSYHYYVKCIKN